MLLWVSAWTAFNGAVLLADIESLAAINHGLNTTFNPAAWGGSSHVFCLTASIPGTCDTGYNATCNGSSDDQSALNTARTAAIANNPALWILYIPPGSNCGFLSGSSSFVWGGTSAGDSSLPGVTNAVIWAYGATFRTINGMRIGGASFFEDSTHEAFIVSANAGDAAVTLITAADSSIFSVGDDISVTGLAIQTCCGFPLNFQRCEFHKITSITGTTTKVIGLDSRLKFTYLSTWPSIQQDAAMGNSGPAKIYKMTPSWPINLTLNGGTIAVATFSGSQDSIIGKYVQVNNTTFLSENTSPSVNLVATINGSSTDGMEVDKCIDTLNMNSDSVRSNLTFQSPAPTTFNGSGINVLGTLNGTPWNSTFANSRFGAIRLGPSGIYGVGNSIYFSNSVLPIGSTLTNNEVNAVDMTFTAGTLSVAHASSSAFDKALAWGIPGHKYAFADNDGTLNSSPPTTFSISAVRDDGTTIFFDMSGCSWGTCSGALPTPTCNTHACPEYVAYPAATITQTNSGPADLTQFAAPP